MTLAHAFKAQEPADPLCMVLDTSSLVDVPVQYFQSVIAIELAVAGALLWQMRFFESGNEARRD